MCEYCDFSKEENKQLKTREIDFGILGKAELTAEIEESYDEKEVFLESWFCNDDFAYGISIKINYCPMCGRKLTEGNNV